MFGKDGSLYVNCPYFRETNGILASGIIPGNGQQNFNVDLKDGGRVSSHLVKYSHHPDGRAHFSQAGKVYTSIKKQSVPLTEHSGHIFTVTVQGVEGMEAARSSDKGVGERRAYLDFPEESSIAIKFVGRWYSVGALRTDKPLQSVGPQVPCVLPNEEQRNGVLLASPDPNGHHVLLLSVEPIRPLTPTGESRMLFFGGFDGSEIMNDVNRDGGFLAFMYPADDLDGLKRTLGSVDFVP